ncbi:MAG TPA: aminodeoxychorismate synthase component I [Streptosporangiaceae bacterium]
MPDTRSARTICEPLDWDLPTVAVLRMVRDDAHPAALTGAWAGGSDIVSAEPTTICTDPDEPWPALDEPGPAQGVLQGSGPAAAFAGGWLGYLGFGLAGQVLPVPPAPGGPRRLPSWWLGYYDHVLRRDRASGRWYFEALRTPQRAAALDARLAELRRRASAGVPQAAGYQCGDFRLLPSAREHRSAVRRAVDYVWQGDIFQANICLRFEAAFCGDPLDAFCAAVTELDPAYAAFIRPAADTAVASLSPELFLRRQGIAVTSRPVKGTTARPADPDAAAQQLARLHRSAKDRAENVMIVDLMRNDLSRVCEPGSVTVPRLAAGEPHPGIWHLVSDVCGTLRADASDGQLVRATFPPGSVTGAPKVRALEVIHELESTPREVYCGAIGYRSPVAGLELNVAIRTFEFVAGHAWLGAGGGIVAASRPAAEYRECLLKARPLIAALGGRIRTRPLRGETAATDPALRPRPAAGVFTSLEVRDGRTQHLAEHLGRLSASARALFGKDLPPSLMAELDRMLAGRPTGRLRITVLPLGGPLHATVEVVPADSAAAPVTVVDLVSSVVPGGIGGHKWADRRRLGLLAPAGRPGGQALILDSDGAALETDRANVFAVCDGTLRTPPADGRLLPGVTRAAVLRLAAQAGVPVRTGPVTAADLASASEAFVTNAVRGVLGVRSVDGAPLPAAPGPVTLRIAALLAAVPVDAPPAERSRRPPARTGGSRRPVAGPLSGPAVLVLDNYDSFTYNLVHYLAKAGCAVTVARNDEATAADIAAAGPAGVVISPGPCAPAEAGISIEVVRVCAETGIPVLGICLGHQAIAASYGAAIVAAPRPVHGQTSLISHDGTGVLAGLPRRFRATRYHSLIVAEQTLPPELAVTARTSDGIPMALRHCELPVEGVQFHPESVLTSHGQAIITSFARSLRSAAGRKRPTTAGESGRDFRTA